MGNLLPLVHRHGGNDLTSKPIITLYFVHRKRLVGGDIDEEHFDLLCY